MRILIVLVIRARPISAAQLQWSNACNVRILRAPRVRQARRYDRANPFATPKQDAHSGGEGNTEQLAGIDAILIVDADDASSFLLGKRNGFRFALAQAKVRLQLCDQLPVLHKNNLDSRLIQGWIVSASRVFFAARLYWMLREEVHYAQLLQGSDAGQPEPFCGRG